MSNTSSLNNIKTQIKILSQEVNRLSNGEQAIKIVLNGGYGYIGNTNSRYFDLAIAEGITSTGQIAIRFITDKINTFVNIHSNTENVDYVASSDTDSTLGSTNLITSIGEISISELYNRYTNEQTELEANKGNKDSVRTLTEKISSLSFNGTELEYKPINYIMKHKVKKRMYKIKCKGKEIEITEDHGMIVMRDGVMKTIKPSETLKTDKLLKIIR